MRMSRVLYGLAALPLLAGVALAETPNQSSDSKVLAKEPMRLTAQQMDKVRPGGASRSWISSIRVLPRYLSIRTE
jgi:hypothetical protein